MDGERERERDRETEDDQNIDGALQGLDIVAELGYRVRLQQV